MRKGLKQFWDLLGIAAEICADDIHQVIGMFLGVIIGMMTTAGFFLLNLGTNYKQYLDLPYNDLAGAYVMSIFLGFLNAFFTLLFIAICVILFEFAYTFTKVCYWYDDRSWAVPNFIKSIPSLTLNFLLWINATGKESREKARIRSDNRTQELECKLLAIKYPEDL